MIQRFSFGHPFPTQSVVLSLPAESGPVPFLTPDGTGWRFTLSEQAAVYGLGEMPRGINKRGWHYITNNTDESRHSEDKLSFYGAHNFLLVRDGSTCFGLFVDFPGKVYYDIGYTRHDLFSFHTETPDSVSYTHLKVLLWHHQGGARPRRCGRGRHRHFARRGKPQEVRPVSYTHLPCWMPGRMRSHRALQAWCTSLTRSSFSSAAA